jgi:deoxyadenosine/deoxycytidine kinase
MNNLNNNIIVSIEGNIGSGKSTLLANLQKYFDNDKKIIFLKEPVDEWSTIFDENNVTMLEKFYSDQKKYSFSFQMMAYISRLAILKQTLATNNNSIIITERSLFTDRLVFAKMLYDSGNIEVVNYKIYLKWFDTFAIDYPVKFVIYVNASPGVCFERIIKRSRKGESNIPLNYLENCHKYHEEMIMSSNSEYIQKSNMLLLLDGNIDIYDNPTKLNDWIEEIKKIISI